MKTKENIECDKWGETVRHVRLASQRPSKCHPRRTADLFSVGRQPTSGGVAPGNAATQTQTPFTATFSCALLEDIPPPVLYRIHCSARELRRNPLPGPSWLCTRLTERLFLLRTERLPLCSLSLLLIRPGRACDMIRRLPRRWREGCPRCSVGRWDLPYGGFR